MNIRALVLDGYGTIWNIDSVIPECERAFPGYGSRLSQRWRERQIEYTRRSILTGYYEDLWTLVARALASACRELDLELPQDLQVHLQNQYLALNVFPEVLEALPRLAAHYRLAILSHGTRKMLDAMIERNQIGGYFEAVMTVDAVRAYKPVPRAYAHAVEALNLPRKEIAYVGVNPFDIAGAKGFGLGTIWIHRTGPPSRPMNLLCDIQSPDLATMVESLNMLRKTDGHP